MVSCKGYGDVIVLDIEADGFIFESTTVWTVCGKNATTGEKIGVNPFKEPDAKERLLKFIHSSEVPLVVGHFWLGYDSFVLQNLLGMDFTVGKDTLCGKPVQYVDTFYLSMFLNPDREGHSIEWWGEQLGLHKIDYRQRLIDLGVLEKDAPEGSQFSFHHPEMDVYCERDVDVNEKVVVELFKEWEELYQSPFTITDAFKCGQKSFYLMSCQELAGWKFDVPAAQALEKRIEQMMEDIRVVVEPQLPPRPPKKSEEKEYTIPAKPFKKDGSLSSVMLRWIERHQGIANIDGTWDFYGKTYHLVPNLLLDVSMPMEMANQDQMKDYFISCGWKPSLWNFKKGADGKPLRDPVTRQLIKTSPKIQEQGKICPNLLELDGDTVKQVVKWLSLRNRQAVLRGWLSQPRLQMDGRIGAGRTGIAATHRQKHKVVVNVPKASDKVLLGHEFRSLWICEDGMEIAAGDAAALEGRVQGHYVYKYDGGATADELLRGDPHSKNAYAFYSHIDEVRQFDITAKDFNKDHPVWKPYRDRSKNGYYALLYGCAAPKLAATLGIPAHLGEEKMAAFWEANPATKELKDNLEAYWELTGRKQFLPAIDGRILRTRKKSALLNTIFQSCGGIVMDYAGCFMDMWLGGMKWLDRKPYYLYKGCVVRRIGYFHDELEFECDKAVAKEVATMIEQAIKKAGEYLKIKIELAGEGKVGKSWKEVH